jgi:hypothetical protein
MKKRILFISSPIRGMGRRPFIGPNEAMGALGKADVALDALWRGLYGQPLPISGSPELALQIIMECEQKTWSPPPGPDAIDDPSGVRRRSRACS